MNLKEKLEQELKINGDNSELYFRYYNLLLNVKHKTEQNFLIMGYILKQVKDKQLYKINYDTWGQFLAQPELNFSREWANRLIKIYEEFKDYALDKLIQIGVSKLALVTKIIDKEVTKKDEVLEQIKDLSYRDAKKVIYEMKGVNVLDKELEKAENLKKMLLDFLNQLWQDDIIEIRNDVKLKEKITSFIYIFSQNI